MVLRGLNTTREAQGRWHAMCGQGRDDREATKRTEGQGNYGQGNETTGAGPLVDRCGLPGPSFLGPTFATPAPAPLPNAYGSLVGLMAFPLLPMNGPRLVLIFVDRQHQAAVGEFELGLV